ncbi:MAG: PilZ domain-containing protein [Thermodesulfobacteriota bacterium]
METIDLRMEARFPMTPNLKERFSLKLRLDDNRTIPLELLDVSLHGMRFRTDLNLAERSVEEFFFIYRDKNKNTQEFKILSRICWIEEEWGKDDFNIGTSIVEVSDQIWMKLILDALDNM